MPVRDGYGEGEWLMFELFKATAAKAGFRRLQDPIDFFKEIGFDPNLTPYMMEPYRRACLDKTLDMTLCFAERMGKTVVAYSSLLYRMRHKPSSVQTGMIVYKSDDFARQMNETKFEPLINKLTEFQGILNQRENSRKDFYNIGTSRIYFQGSGRDIVGLDVPWRYGDEVDFWEGVEQDGREGRVNNLLNLRKRGFSFKENIFIKSSSPTVLSGRVWQEFLKTTMGYWHLRCLGCGRLSMRSADVHNLQWSNVEEDGLKTPVPDSIRLVCPECGKQHMEREKYEMNMQGAYVFKHPERSSSTVGYQAGALASLQPGHTWFMIAEAQLGASYRADIESVSFFDNSIRGLPYKRRVESGQRRANLEQHKSPKPEKSDILFTTLAADTQDNGWWYVVRAHAKNESSWLLAYGFVRTIEELMDQEAKWLCSFVVVDAGGHRPREVERYVGGSGRRYAYKGGYTSSMVSRSSKETRLLLANSKLFQGALLHQMYHQHDRSKPYWHLPEDIGEDYMAQLLDPRPGSKKGKDELQQWEGTGQDHLFDSEKMTMVLIWAIKRGLVDKVSLLTNDPARTPQRKITQSVSYSDF